MSRSEWAVLASIVGVVAIAIATEPNHDEMNMGGADHAAMAMAAPTSHTVALAVSGMT